MRKSFPHSAPVDRSWTLDPSNQRRDAPFEPYIVSSSLPSTSSAYLRSSTDDTGSSNRPAIPVQHCIQPDSQHSVLLNLNHGSASTTFGSNAGTRSEHYAPQSPYENHFTSTGNLDLNMSSMQLQAPPQNFNGHFLATSPNLDTLSSATEARSTGEVASAPTSSSSNLNSPGIRLSPSSASFPVYQTYSIRHPHPSSASLAQHFEAPYPGQAGHSNPRASNNHQYAQQQPRYYSSTDVRPSSSHSSSSASSSTLQHQARFNASSSMPATTQTSEHYTFPPSPAAVHHSVPVSSSFADHRIASMPSYDRNEPWPMSKSSSQSSNDGAFQLRSSIPPPLQFVPSASSFHRLSPPSNLPPRSTSTPPPTTGASGGEENWSGSAESGDEEDDQMTPEGKRKRRRRRTAMEEPRDAALRRFGCETCGKMFARPSALKTHERSHSKEKPHICPEPTCSRPFAVPSNLRRHQKVYNHWASSDGRPSSALRSSASSSRNTRPSTSSRKAGLERESWGSEDEDAFGEDDDEDAEEVLVRNRGTRTRGGIMGQ